jgi:hypothetical protein
MPLNPEDIRTKLPLLLDWIRQTLATHRNRAQPVASLGFARLPRYFSPALLDSSRVVVVERLPVPPLTRLGLPQFAEMERFQLGGITYFDTFFVTAGETANEALHFHELVHVVQWSLLGPERFMLRYAEGLATHGYRDSPLEVMAYDLEERFKRSRVVFDAELEIARQLTMPI